MELEIGYDLSCRRACRLIELQPSSFYYEAKPTKDETLRLRIKELAAQRVRFGYRRIHMLLLREGWKVNHKKVHRIYLEENLTVRTKKRKKLANRPRVPLGKAEAPNEQRSMDFVMDRTEDGKPVENAYIESFKGRLRDECLDTHLFFSVEDASKKFLTWRQDYNKERPQKALEIRTPEEYFDAWMQSPL